MRCAYAAASTVNCPTNGRTHTATRICVLRPHVVSMVLVANERWSEKGIVKQNQTMKNRNKKNLDPGEFQI